MVSSHCNVIAVDRRHHRRASVDTIFFSPKQMLFSIYLCSVSITASPIGSVLMQWGHYSSHVGSLSRFESTSLLHVWIGINCLPCKLVSQALGSLICELHPTFNFCTSTERSIFIPEILPLPDGVDIHSVCPLVFPMTMISVL